MATPYTREALAQFIASGQDAGTAAEVFNRSLHFIQSEQGTREYAYYFDRAKQRVRQARDGKPGEPGNPALIEIEDVTGGIRVRGKSGNELDFDAWHNVRDGIDGRDGRDGDGTSIFYKVRPFHRGIHGKFFRGIRAFPEDRVKPFYRGVHGGFHRGVSGQQDEKRSQDATDILSLFDGVPEKVADYMWELLSDRIPEELTGSELIAVLNALPVGSRLNINWLDGSLSIPTNTASWHGAWQTLTAYASGSIVTDSGSVFIYIVDIPATNTVRPAADTAARVEHLDVGSPLDITNVSKTGLTFTFTRRSGANFTIEISANNLYAGMQRMTDAQWEAIVFRLFNSIDNAAKASIFFKMVTALTSAQDAAVLNHLGGSPKNHSHSGFAPASHNHDARYYTEGEANSRFASRSHNHNAQYYTEAEMDALLSGKSNVGHNHDSRYYTEGESNTRFATRNHDHPDPTATQVLAALAAMTTAQENSARAAIKAFGKVANITSGSVLLGLSDTITRDVIIGFTRDNNNVITGTFAQSGTYAMQSTQTKSFHYWAFDLIP